MREGLACYELIDQVGREVVIKGWVGYTHSRLEFFRCLSLSPALEKVE